VDFRSRATNYNQFQEKMDQGTAQTFFWGWHADYPDPENFLFLLHTEQGKVRYHGENAGNYSNPQFDSIFQTLQTMENTPERLKLVHDAVAVLQADAPWVWGFHPVDYALRHQWYSNIKPLVIARNTLKYRRIDPALRADLREKWNKPILMPVIALLAVAAGVVVWVAFSLRMRRHRVASRREIQGGTT